MTVYETRKQDVVGYAQERYVKLYEVAHKIGCTDGTLSRKLRYMEESDADFFKNIIDQIVADRNGDQ